MAGAYFPDRYGALVLGNDTPSALLLLVRNGFVLAAGVLMATPLWSLAHEAVPRELSSSAQPASST